MSDSAAVSGRTAGRRRRSAVHQTPTPSQRRGPGPAGTSRRTTWRQPPPPDSVLEPRFLERAERARERSQLDAVFPATRADCASSAGVARQAAAFYVQNFVHAGF